MTQLIRHLSEISAQYDAMFVDLWGCVHNGVTAFPSAVAALQDYRRNGGIVIFVTNAPRAREHVAAQLERLGVPSDCYDSIATSGDSARAAMYRGVVGAKVYHIGEPHDESFFEPLAVIKDPVDITRTGLDDADGIVCTGPFDPLDDPEIYRKDLLKAKVRGLKLLCANPDIVVDKGEVREWCAGALAQLYTEMGGESLYFGKPHPPIYDLARRRLADVRMVDESRILCIGDGVNTDVQGGLGEGLDTLFITGGLAAHEFGADPEFPDQAMLTAWLAQKQLHATAAISFLR